MDNQKKVIVVGSGNSGSGAIYDYLALRKDFIAPLNQEFRLIQDPDGIMDLHSSLVHGFHVNRANGAIKNFIDFCERCSRKKTKYQLGLNYSRDIPDFEKKVSRFIDEITSVEYTGMPFCEQSKLSKWETYVYRKRHKRAKKKGEKLLYGNVRLPVTEDLFLKAAERFLNTIFDDSQPENNGKHIAIDQGGSYWNPASSNTYYGKNGKTIVVSRDPRGVFSSFKTKGRAYPGYDVTLFCKWYKQMMLHVDYSEWEHEDVLHIQFEDFVKNFDEEKIKLDAFLGLPADVQTSLNVSRSAFNAEKYRNRLTSDEMKTIEDELEEYLYF